MENDTFRRNSLEFQLKLEKKELTKDFMRATVSCKFISKKKRGSKSTCNPSGSITTNQE